MPCQAATIGVGLMGEKRLYCWKEGTVSNLRTHSSDEELFSPPESLRPTLHKALEFGVRGETRSVAPSRALVATLSS